MIRGPRRLPKLEAHVNAIAEINVLRTTLPPLGGKNPQTTLYYSRKGWANRLEEMWVIKYPVVSGIFLRCSPGSPAKIALLVTSLLKCLLKVLGDFRGKSWGSSQPFSSDAQIISIPLQMFINSSRCHTLGLEVSGERKATLVGKGSEWKQPNRKTGAQQPLCPLGLPLLDRSPRWWVSFPFLPGNIIRI